MKENEVHLSRMAELEDIPQGVQDQLEESNSKTDASNLLLSQTRAEHDLAHEGKVAAQQHAMDLEDELRKTRSNVEESQATLAAMLSDRDAALSKVESTLVLLKQAEADATKLGADIDKCQGLLQKVHAKRELLQQTSKASMRRVVELEDELKKSKEQLKHEIDKQLGAESMERETASASLEAAHTKGASQSQRRSKL